MCQYITLKGEIYIKEAIWMHIPVYSLLYIASMMLADRVIK